MPWGFPRDGVDRNFFDGFLGQWSRGRPNWDFFSDLVHEIHTAVGKPAATLSPDRSS